MNNARRIRKKFKELRAKRSHKVRYLRWHLKITVWDRCNQRFLKSGTKFDTGVLRPYVDSKHPNIIPTQYTKHAVNATTLPKSEWIGDWPEGDPLNDPAIVCDCKGNKVSLEMTIPEFNEFQKSSPLFGPVDPVPIIESKIDEVLEALKIPKKIFLAGDENGEEKYPVITKKEALLEYKKIKALRK